MALLDSLKSAFGKKPATSAVDSMVAESDAEAVNFDQPADNFRESKLAGSIATENVASTKVISRDGMVDVPGLGYKTVGQHQRVFGIALAAFLVLLLATAAFSLYQAAQVTAQVGAVEPGRDQAPTYAGRADALGVGRHILCPFAGGKFDVGAEVQRHAGGGYQKSHQRRLPIALVRQGCGETVADGPDERKARDRGDQFPREGGEERRHGRTNQSD